MKIGIFSECYHPTINGVVVSIDTFKECLEKRGHEIFIFAPKTKGFVDEDKEHIFRFPTVVWPGQKNYPLALPWVKYAKSILPQGLKLDIIHCQHLFTMGHLGLRTGRKLGIPVVYTYHTLIAEYGHYAFLIEPLVKKYLIRASRNFCNEVDRVVTPTPSMKKVLEGYGVKAPIEVIPTGIKLVEFHRTDKRVVRAKYGIPEDSKLLLYVGRLALEKNLMVLLEAFETVVKKIPKAHLALVGSGPEENHFKEWIRERNLIRNVTFTGFLTHDDTEKIFGAADIFTFPSTSDTQGLVIVEAMASKTPPVAADKLGPSDIIRDGIDGYLIEPTPEEFMEKIIKLIDNPELLEKMGEAGVERAKEYSDEASAIKMEKLYVGLTNSNNT